MSALRFFRSFPPTLRRFLLVSTFAILGLIAWLMWSLSVPRTQESRYTISYRIYAGESFNAVLHDLEKSDIIRSYWASKIAQSFAGFSLKKGDYQLSPNMSAWQILKVLNTGEPPLVKLTFPEGLTIQDMAWHLRDQGFYNAQDFLPLARDPATARSLGIPSSNMEGFFFPSTYYVPKSITSLALIKLMVKTFLQKIDSLNKDHRSLADLYSTIILASMVESEAATDKDRPLIASVFLNRIRKKKRLESCATVIYIFETKTGKKKNRVYFKDLQVDSPYNTYRHLGLPPGPISNPGFKSLQAAFHPAQTDYLFFVYKGNGEHIFSNNYADHMRFYRQYIEFQNVKVTKSS